MAAPKIKIQNTNDAVNPCVKALIYGESGTGKTSLAGTLPGKTLVISAEAGLLSLRGKNIDYVNLNTDDEGKTLLTPQEKIDRLVAVYKYLVATKVYDNVFLDSITEIAEMQVAVVQAEFPDRKDSFPMWGEYGKRMRAIVKRFRDLEGYNVYMTCLAELDKDENMRRFWSCDVPGKIGKQLPQFFDEVLMTFVQDGEYKLQTKKLETNMCKDRSGKLDAVEPADLGVLMLKIFDKPKEKK